MTPATEGALTIYDAVGTVHVTAQCVAEVEAKGQPAFAIPLGKGRIGVLLLSRCPLTSAQEAG